MNVFSLSKKHSLYHSIECVCREKNGVIYGTCLWKGSSPSTIAHLSSTATGRVLIDTFPIQIHSQTIQSHRMTEKKERGQEEKKNRGCCACSSDGLAGWFVCLFSLWRWWELSISHCQFSPHWENIHVDSWNPESRVKQTQGQQIQDSASMKHFQIENPSKSSFSSSSKRIVDSRTEGTMFVTNQWCFLLF